MGSKIPVSAWFVVADFVRKNCIKVCVVSSSVVISGGTSVVSGTAETLGTVELTIGWGDGESLLVAVVDVASKGIGIGPETSCRSWFVVTPKEVERGNSSASLRDGAEKRRGGGPTIARYGRGGVPPILTKHNPPIK